MKGRKRTGFVKAVAKGSAKGLARLGRDVVKGVAGELASILTLGLFRPPRRRR